MEPLPELTKVTESADKMQQMLEALMLYVEAVLDGSQEPDSSVGRALHSLVSSSYFYSSPYLLSHFYYLPTCLLLRCNQFPRWILTSLRTS